MPKMFQGLAHPGALLVKRLVPIQPMVGFGCQFDMVEATFRCRKDFDIVVNCLACRIDHLFKRRALVRISIIDQPLHVLLEGGLQLCFRICLDDRFREGCADLLCVESVSVYA